MQQSFFLDNQELLGKSKEKNLIIGCESCNLKSGCKSPKMEPFGKFRKKILIIAQAPGAVEDEKGRPLCGRAGHYLETCLSELGISMDEDCIETNCVMCRPKDNKTPTIEEIQNCYP